MRARPRRNRHPLQLKFRLDFRGLKRLLLTINAHDGNYYSLIVDSQGQYTLISMNLIAFLRDRLKSERQRLGLTQVELGKAGEVDRRTQYKYEAGSSDPTLGYLRGVEGAGVDIPFVLFGVRAEDCQGAIDWPLLWQAVEDVGLFCARRVPDCPEGMRRDLVERLYAAYVEHKRSKQSLTQRQDRNDLVSAIWDKESHG